MATDTMVRVKWLAFANDVGQKDYTWDVGTSQDRPGVIVAWGRHVGQMTAPAEDVKGCEDGLSWHTSLAAAAVAVGGVPNCYEGLAQGLLLALRDDVFVLALKHEPPAALLEVLRDGDDN